jgi:hypothetical protein
MQTWTTDPIVVVFNMDFPLTAHEAHEPSWQNRHWVVLGHGQERSGYFQAVY